MRESFTRPPQQLPLTKHRRVAGDGNRSDAGTAGSGGGGKVGGIRAERRSSACCFSCFTQGRETLSLQRDNNCSSHKGPGPILLFNCAIRGSVFLNSRFYFNSAPHARRYKGLAGEMKCVTNPRLKIVPENVVVVVVGAPSAPS